MAPRPRYLVGAAEISQMLGGLSRQRVQQIINRRDFPKPYDELAMGKVWKRPVVEAWMRENDRTGGDETAADPVTSEPAVKAAGPAPPGRVSRPRLTPAKEQAHLHIRPCRYSARHQAVTGVACLLSAGECFSKRVAATLPVTERGKGWWAMRCPTGHHGAPLRLHVGTQGQVHITYADLGKCPQSETYAWLVKQGIPSGCLAKPKDWPAVERSAQFSSDEGKLADAVLSEAFGEGTTTERLIRIAVLALGGECPEGPVCDVLADRLGLKPRIIYQATAEMRRKARG